MSAMSDTQREPPDLDQATIAQAAALIAGADALVIAAGAGMGVDSGLPDFRGNVGFWKAYPALASDGVGFMDIASPAAFLEHPRRAWGFYGHRLALYRETVPHPGFGLLRKWGETKQNGYFVFTSNVDGHFQRPDSILCVSMSVMDRSTTCSVWNPARNPSGRPGPSPPRSMRRAVNCSAYSRRVRTAVASRAPTS